ACIDNEARYNQARQYGFSEKMSFLPGTNYQACRKQMTEAFAQQGVDPVAANMKAKVHCEQEQ
ncbi:MAG: hypothetical protein KZQ63_21450, partial [Candidatus Thiodiazotropha sp. (ex Lucinoma aequizonata)]|nr:hypothetical protein [Candidatus Thiodiazotropha sp. (ex Lucinoma aequizonata)]